MRTFGAILICGAVFGLIASLGMDTSVSTGYGSVNNIGLMNDKQNYIIISCVLLVAGLIMAVAGSSSQPAEPSPAAASGQAHRVVDDTRKCPFCAESIKREAVKCRYCGEMVEPLEAVELADAAEGVEDDQSAWLAELAAREEEKRKVASTHKIIGAVVGGLFLLMFLLAAIFG